MTNDLSSEFQSDEQGGANDRPQRVEMAVTRRTPRPTAEAAAEQMEYLVQELTNLVAEREVHLNEAAIAANDAAAPVASKPGMFARMFASKSTQSLRRNAP